MGVVKHSLTNTLIAWHRHTAYLKLVQCELETVCRGRLFFTYTWESLWKLVKTDIVLLPGLQLSGMLCHLCIKTFLHLKLLLLFKHVASLSQAWVFSICKEDNSPHICKEDNWPQTSVSVRDEGNSAVSYPLGDPLWEWLRHCSFIHETLKSPNISTSKVSTNYSYFYPCFFMLYIV